jgi:hypothetical protein
MTGGRTGSAASRSAATVRRRSSLACSLISSLHGLLARVRDLGLSLISVRQLDAGDAGDQAQQ